MTRPGESSALVRHGLWIVLGIAVAALIVLGLAAAHTNTDAAAGTPEALASDGPRRITAVATGGPAVQAASGILIDRVSGRVLWQKSPHARRAPASLTKVMTAVIVLERLDDLNTWCVAPAATGHDLGNVVGLRPGERITALQALRAALIKSANDACLTLAVRVAGSEAAFTRLMNDKARALGLTDTRFKNSRGRPMSGHFSSAADLATLARYALLNPRFRRICATQTAVITWPGHAVPIKARNRLLNYDWGEGVKTGATPESGACLIGAGTLAQRPLIVVTLHEPTRRQEEADALKLFAWGDKQYEPRTLVAGGGLVTTVPLAAGGAVRAIASRELTATIHRSAVVETRLALLQPLLESQPEAGWVLGRIEYLADGESLGTVELLADGLAGAAESPEGL